MTTSCRNWWQNCTQEADAEILAIDAMEDQIAPIAENVSRIRTLISTLELCHHKAQRWIHNIIEAIGAGDTQKGLGTRPAGELHPAEKVWQSACAALAAWCAGSPLDSIDISIDTVPAAKLIANLQERSPLKEWQVHRVIDKIRSWIQWPQSEENPAAQYEWLLIGGGEYDLGYCRDCPERYKEHEVFWLATVRTIIHDQDNDNDAELSLALAIDMLWPCHWRFLDNLQIVLEAIGGKLHPEKPFAACGRNIQLLPNRDRLEHISLALKAFYDDSCDTPEGDREILKMLGESTDVKRWLAASLDKTIRLQHNPPPAMRAASALNGPDWIKS